jgi:hypothetical protein
MPEYILSRRRVPRAPVRCEARIALREGGYWASPTSDYGPQGCQVLAPVRLEPGSRIFVELVNERVPGPVGLAGRVAWTAKAPPWHTGVAFDGGSLGAAGGFFARLTAAYPGIEAYGRAPDRIPADAPLAPAPPPPFEPLLTGDEARVVAEIGAGMRADVLRERLAGDWEPGVHAVFSLLGRRYLVLGDPDPAAAAAWTALRAQGG